MDYSVLDKTLQLKLGTIKHDQTGHEALAELHARTKNHALDEIEIDMSECRWFDADMCAGLGAILYKMSSDLNIIRITNIRSSVGEILSKNGFLQTLLPSVHSRPQEGPDVSILPKD